jgi:hypothetical protein
MKGTADETKRGPVQANFKRYNHTNRPNELFNFIENNRDKIIFEE